MNETFHEGSFLHWLLPNLAYTYLSFVGLTARVKESPRPDLPHCAYALWHSSEIMPIWLNRNRGICGLVSQSKDGEYIFRMLRKLGYNLVRGSTSTGAARSLIQLIRAAREGYSMAITPDGPKGPNRKLQPGIIAIAQKAGIPLVPVGCALKGRIRVPSWDRYQIPLPFVKVRVIYGQPIRVLPGDDVAARSLELETAITALDTQAETELAAS